MTLKTPLLSAAFACCLGLCLIAMPSARAGDLCSDVPVCAEGKVLTRITQEDRTDCAMFKCLDATAVGKDDVLVQSEAQLKEILATDISVQCNSDQARVRLRSNNVNGALNWTCVAKTALAHLKKNGALLDEVQIATDIPSRKDTCEDDEALVRIRAQQRGPNPVWTCIKKTSYVFHKRNGDLMEDVLTTPRPTDVVCGKNEILAQSRSVNEDGIVMGRWSCLSMGIYNIRQKSGEIVR